MGTEKRPFFSIDGNKITVDLDEAKRAAGETLELGAGIAQEIATDALKLGDKIGAYLEQKAARAREKMTTPAAPPTDEPKGTDEPTP